MEEPHRHEWKLGQHLDSCHWYSSEYVCACGATRSMYVERTPNDSIFWNEGGDCPRCAEIEAGADPEYEDTITPAP